MKIFTRKRVIWLLIVVVVVGGIAYRVIQKKNAPPDIMTEEVRRQDLKQTVLATGQVTSATDLALSFKVSGVVERLPVRVGDVVKKSAILAQLDQKDQRAQVVSAEGALAEARANHQKILDGARSEEIAVAEASLASAEVSLKNAENERLQTQKQQDVLVANAQSALFNTSPEAVVVAPFTTVTPTVSGTYTSIEPGEYRIKVSLTPDGPYANVSGLEVGSELIKANVPIRIGTRGLYLVFASVVFNNNDEWVVAIPNMRSSQYITNLNAYSAALETRSKAIEAADASVRSATSSRDKAAADLELKRSKARPYEVDAALAAIKSAEGRYQAALAALENTVLRAPTDGTITKVDIKLGELASALEPVIVVQDVGMLRVEANLSEANIALVRIGQKVDVTFDALGTDRHFTATVDSIDPASTVVGGVVNYRIVVGFGEVEEIKPGMTANLAVMVAERTGVLAVPLRAVVDEEGAKAVRVVTDPVKKTYEPVEVTTGIDADGGLVEITGGLSEGQEVVTLVGAK